MDRYELDQAVNRQMDAAYWPWWFAVAYVQPWGVRVEALRSGVETYLAFKGSSVDAVGALGRVIAVLCGDDDPDGETFRVWQTRAEDRLMMAIRAGKVRAWGYPSPDATLVELKPSDWVGGEVDCSDTCDLVKEGWRGAGFLSQAVDLERVVRFSDIHLPREQVMAWADHLEQEAHRQVEDLNDAQNSEFFYGLGVSDGDLVEGFWSAFVTCAWIGSRCREFTAKAQQFERDGLADLGGVYSATAWSVMGGALRHKFGVSDYDALRMVQQAIALNKLPAGGGFDKRAGQRREIANVEWQEMKSPIHDHDGTSHLPGLYNIQWSSADVMAAFPHLPAEADADAEAVSIVPLVQSNVAPASPNWARRPAKQRVASLFVFFEKAARHMPGGSDPRSADELFGDYEAWLAKQKDEGLRRTQFREWWERYVEGWRIGSRQRFYLTET
jgi:hypothetical protein